MNENARLTQICQEVRTELQDVRREQGEQMTQMQARMEEMMRRQEEMLTARFNQEIERRFTQFGSQFPVPPPSHPPSTGQPHSQAAPEDDDHDNYAPTEDLGRD